MPTSPPTVEAARARLDARRRSKTRNFVLLGCGLGFGGFGMLLAGGLGLHQWQVRADPIFQAALSVANTEDVALRQSLGWPLRPAVFARGPLLPGQEGVDAHFEVGVRGDLGQGTLIVDGIRYGTEVSFRRLELVPAAGEPVDLAPTAEAWRRSMKDKEAAPLIEEAQRLHKRGQLAEAETACDHALALAGESREALLLRALLREERGDFAGGLADLEVVERQEALMREDLSRKGRCQRGLGQLDACIATFTEVIRSDADDGNAWFQRARCMADRDEANNEAERRSALAGAREACRLGNRAGCELSASLAGEE